MCSKTVHECPNQRRDRLDFGGPHRKSRANDSTVKRLSAGIRRAEQYIRTPAGPEGGASDAGDNGDGDDGARGFVSGRKAVYAYDAIGNISGVPTF